MTSSPLTFIGLHYFAGSGLEWQALAAKLAPGYPLLAPDLGGFGGAPAPAGGYTVAAYADQIAGYIRERELTRYVLVGHSMGGKIALALAARQPAGLVGLVLLTPSPPAAEPMTEDDRQANLRAWGKPTAAEKTSRKITVRPLAEAVNQQVVADSLRSTKAAWEAWLLHGSRENIVGLLPPLAVPCLLIAGDSDPVMSPSVHGLETLPHLPAGTPLEIIPGAGHLLPYEAPDEVAALLANFGARLAAER